MKQRSDAFVLALALTTASIAQAAPIVRSAGGDTTQASIQAAVNQFLTDIGAPNNGNAPGPLFSGRREINWDGGGNANASAVGTPFAGFQNRGAIFTTPGTGFTQAPIAAGTGNLSTINANYATTFSFFSPVRVFTPLGSNTTDADFSIPGSNGAIPAAVSGFGAVFSDVDLPNTTSIEFFAFNGVSLGKFFVPDGTVDDGSLSFLGVSFTEGSIIGRVRITTGNSALGPNDSAAADVVVMDDFFYREPQRVPEPPIHLLLGIALAGLALARRKK